MRSQARPAPSNQCFADMDKTMMEEVVTWVPWCWANNWTSSTRDSMTQYVYDRTPVTRPAQLAVNNGLAPENVA